MLLGLLNNRLVLQPVLCRAILIKKKGLYSRIGSEAVILKILLKNAEVTKGKI